MTLTIAVFAPMPTASVAIAIAAKAGALRSVRTAQVTSCAKVFIGRTGSYAARAVVFRDASRGQQREERAWDDRPERLPEREPGDHGAGHRAGEHRDAGHRQPRDEREQSAGDLHRAGQITEPLSEPNPVEEADPHRIGELRPADADEDYCDREPRQPRRQQVDAARDPVLFQFEHRVLLAGRHATSRVQARLGWTPSGPQEFRR